MAELRVKKKLKRKEAIVLAIDIGSNSLQLDSDGKSYFEKSVYCASMIIKRKILTESEDHLALLLFGSYHTVNHLSSQGSCYDGIETVAGLGKPTWDLFNRVNSLSSTYKKPSDWISTFVLAADFLRNETENKVFSGLQIVMFSNLATDISFSNIDIIAKCLKLENIRLSILGKDCEAISRNQASDVFLKKTKATAVNLDTVRPKISYYKQKEVIARSWNASLSFGEVFDIKVCGYQKIDITTKSSNWLFSKNYDTQDLTTAKKEHSDDNGEQMEVDNELPIGNFHFSDHIIPAIDLDTEECTYIVAGQRSLQGLGFVTTTTTQISFFLDGGSYIFKPYKTDIIQFNALYKYMVKRKEVMVVRRVDLCINLLKIGILIPQKEENEKFFVYVNLPYDDEKNDTYGLPSLESVKSHLKEKIALKHTDAMDIDIDDRNTFVMPEYKNVQLQSTYNCIVQQILPKIYPTKNQCEPSSLAEYIRMTKNGGPRLQDFFNRISFKREFFENLPSSANLMIKDYDEELDVSNESIRQAQRLRRNAKPLNKFKKTTSIKLEVLGNGSAEGLDVSNESIRQAQRLRRNAKPLNKFKKTNSIKLEVLENGSAEGLDVSNESIRQAQRLRRNAKPLNKFKKTNSIKLEVLENDSAEGLDVSNESIRHAKRLRRNAKPLNKLKKTTSIKLEVLENGSAEGLDGSNELIRPPKRFIRNAEPLNKLKKTISIKQEVLENGSDEDFNTIDFGYDEELDGSNELTNPTKSFIENDNQPLDKLKTTLSIKQEVMENGSAEDFNTIHFGYDEELDGSNELTNPTKSFIENDNQPLDKLKTTLSIKQEVLENGSAEDFNTIHFCYDEELDGSNELTNPTKSFIENDNQPLDKLKTTLSIKQEVLENSSDEDINTIHFGYDEELDDSNELKKTLSIKQEILENGSAEDFNTIHFGYDEELDGSNELTNPTKSFIENDNQPLDKLKTTLSIQQETIENSSDEDINTIHFGYDEELDDSKQCVITPLNPIEDFNNLLKNGFDSTIVCKKMHDVTLNLIELSTNLEDLMKPIDTLKTLREFYINNNDPKSYNDWMYLVKDALVMSGNGSMWSKFINSGIGLITNAEIETSDISQRSSEEFMKLSGDLDIDFVIDGVVN